MPREWFRNGRTRYFAALAVALWSACSGAGSADPAPRDTASDGGSAVVRTRSGDVSGVVTAGVAAFKGIPYAAPPVGNLRWRAPQPPASWTGALAADDYGMTCEQPGPIQHVPRGSRAETKSEDCLTLNVWTPAVHAKPLPVFVWIYGGGNANGASANRAYDGSAFARDGVVLVSMNYRVGLFGFFAHPLLTAERPGDATGNFGLLDQIAALKWVRANVAAFGGDPKNVTVGGVSAGAQDALLLATSQAATGLFARAIAESPYQLWKHLLSLQEAEARGVTTAAALSDATPITLAELRAIPAEKLENATGPEYVGPVVDGTVIAGPVSSGFEGAPRVPTIVGTTADEGSIIGDGGKLATVARGLSVAGLASICERYAKRGISSDSAVARQLFGDVFFAAPAHWFAARAAAAGVPAYLYRFDYVASANAAEGRHFGAAHSSDVPFAFDTLPPSALDETDRTIVAEIHGRWVSFVKSGSPTSAGVASWLPYDAASASEMIFDSAPSMRDPGDGAVMDVLEHDLSPR